jgi:hypothetical protein
MCECCGHHDLDALYLPEAEKLVTTTPMNARDRSLDLKFDGGDSGRIDPESPPGRQVIDATGQPPLLKNS